MFWFEIHFSWNLFQILFRYLVVTAKWDWMECYFPLCDLVLIHLQAILPALTDTVWTKNFFQLIQPVKKPFFFLEVSYIQKTRKCSYISFASKILNTFNYFMYLQIICYIKMKEKLYTILVIFVSAGKVLNHLFWITF